MHQGYFMAKNTFVAWQPLKNMQKLPICFFQKQ